MEENSAARKSQLKRKTTREDDLLLKWKIERIYYLIENKTW